MQRQADKGGEGVEGGMRVGENKGKERVNGNTQTEAPRNSNLVGVRGGNNGKDDVGDRQATGSRVYRQDTRGTEPGPSQTTLKEMWNLKEREKDLHAWSEHMEEQL